jgi:predicted nucleic acid-binding protein
VTVFIDTSVLMYAAGADHPLRDACQRIVQRVQARDIDAVTSVEVVQEIVHRFIAIRRPDLARRIGEATLDLFAPVLPVTHATMRRFPDLVERYPALQARDIVHVATCLNEGIVDIVSSDRGFDAVAEVRRIDPLAFGG